MNATRILSIAWLLWASATGALADKNGVPAHGARAMHAPPAHHEFRFSEREREAVRVYYSDSARAHAGLCPPGLAKKGQGCRPPGQARKWRVGQPLPRGVVYHDLPPDLRRRLPPPPEGHRYVRVAADILMIAVGTAMIVDAMEDIVR